MQSNGRERQESVEEATVRVSCTDADCDYGQDHTSQNRTHAIATAMVDCAIHDHRCRRTLVGDDDFPPTRSTITGPDAADMTVEVLEG